LLGFDNKLKEEKRSIEIKEQKEYNIARVISKNRGYYILVTENGEKSARLKGNYHFQNNEILESNPTVGDWCLYSEFEGGTIQIERFLTLVYESGAKPVIVMSKADLCEGDLELREKLALIETIAYGVPIFAVSITDKEQMEKLESNIKKGETIVFIGSSGVGKSSIINYLLGGQVQKTASVSESNHKGRHTTTSAQLLVNDKEYCIVDTPGLKTVDLWNEETALDSTFSDISTLAQSCKYDDCAHQNEPGCAVIDAIEKGNLDEKRLQNYHKLLRETQYLSLKKEKLKLRNNHTKDKQYKRQNTDYMNND